MMESGFGQKRTVLMHFFLDYCQFYLGARFLDRTRVKGLAELPDVHYTAVGIVGADCLKRILIMIALARMNKSAKGNVRSPMS